jgi:hypothetical protein
MECTRSEDIRLNFTSCDKQYAYCGFSKLHLYCKDVAIELPVVAVITVTAERRLIVPLHPMQKLR